MKNRIIKWQSWYLNIALVLILQAFPGVFTPIQFKTTCPGPDVSVTGQTASSASFAWSAVSGASGYVVYYVKHGDNLPSQPVQTSNTTITCSGLSSGTYDFYFATVCGSEYSDFIIIEDLII